MNNNTAVAAGRALMREDAEVSVLRFLWASRAEWSGREIARKVGLSAPACHAALKGLDSRGLAHFRRVSNLHLYRINPENYLVRSAFTPLFEAEAAMPKAIEAAITGTLTRPAKPAVTALVLFGSRTRVAEARPTSDLDLMVVLASKEDLAVLEAKLERLKESLFRRFHVPLSPYVQTLSELREKHRRKLPLVGEILKDGRTIYGMDLKEMLQ